MVVSVRMASMGPATTHTLAPFFGKGVQLAVGDYVIVQVCSRHGQVVYPPGWTVWPFDPPSAWRQLQRQDLPFSVTVTVDTASDITAELYLVRAASVASPDELSTITSTT